MFVSSLELDNKCDTTVCHLVHPGVSFFLLYLWWSVVLNLDNSFSLRFLFIFLKPRVMLSRIFELVIIFVTCDKKILCMTIYLLKF